VSAKGNVSEEKRVLVTHHILVGLLKENCNPHQNKRKKSMKTDIALKKNS